MCRPFLLSSPTTFRCWLSFYTPSFSSISHDSPSTITLSTTTTTAFVASFIRVVSLPTHEPLVFNDANRYKVWHSAMREEIQALRANKTWSLVPFHPFMNVIDSRWVYKIERRSDGSMERYKAHLVAEVSLSKKILITLKPLVLLSNRRPSD